MMIQVKAKLALGSMVLAATLLTGCATTAPSAKFTKVPAKAEIVAGNDRVMVEVSAKEGVPALPADIARVKQVIEHQTMLKQKSGTVSAQPRSYKVNVNLTRYERGNAFARFMLAGLGQMHIDAHVTVLGLPDGEEVGSFDISKTFAWGGMVGANTRMEDIEPAFADGLANALTGTSAKKKEQVAVK